MLSPMIGIALIGIYTSYQGATAAPPQATITPDLCQEQESADHGANGEPACCGNRSLLSYSPFCPSPGTWCECVVGNCTGNSQNPVMGNFNCDAGPYEEYGSTKCYSHSGGQELCGRRRACVPGPEGPPYGPCVNTQYPWMGGGSTVCGEEPWPNCGACFFPPERPCIPDYEWTPVYAPLMVPALDDGSPIPCVNQ